MTYQGERARPLSTEVGRCFEVSKVRIGADGHALEVLWTELNTGPDRVAGPLLRATAADVVDAIHDGARVAAVFLSGHRLPERRFVVVEHQHDGRECIAFDGEPSPGRNLADMLRLDPLPAAQLDRQPAPAAPSLTERGLATWAVSKVGLDSAGRIAAVLWGRVDPDKNDWAAEEVEVPVAKAVQVLSAGNRVFALFPSDHGHLPERQFMVANYDGGLQTIVLTGPAAKDREVHDMDRLTSPEPL